MNLTKLAALIAVGLTLPAAAFAATCPTLTGASSAYVTAGGGCNTLITLNADGTATITEPNANPYDGSEDNYVGIINNTGSAISSLALSGSDIFGFDGDGIDTFGIAGNSSDTSGYGGADAYFTITDVSDGSVNFLTPIAANGGTDSFSLEEAPSLGSLTVGGSAPEPSSLILLGTGVLGLAGSLRRRIISAIR